MATIARQRPIAPTAGMGVPRTQPVQQSPQGPYSGSPNPGRSGTDPRGRVQNQGNYQQQRFESQVDPMMDQFAQNYGRGTEQGFKDYGSIMSQYKGVANAPGHTDPFNSYAGYQDFSKTGGYSPTDISGMRARGVSPIRAAYSNAEREVGRQRSLQGGYSPNATATLAKMAREQGQAGSDAAGNVEAQLAQMKQQGKLAGLSGMQGIEGQRLNAQFQDRNTQLNAIQGQAGLYGATPGMASTFGNQLNSSVGTSGQFGLDLMRNDIAGQGLPGQWDTTTGRINDVANMAYPFLDYFENRNKGQVPSAGPAVVPTPKMDGPQIFPSGNPQVQTGVQTGNTPGTIPQGSIFNNPKPPPYGGATPPISPIPSYRGGVSPTTPPPYQPGYNAAGAGAPINQEKRRFAV